MGANTTREVKEFHRESSLKTKGVSNGERSENKSLGEGSPFKILQHVCLKDEGYKREFKVLCSQIDKVC